jgi:2-amino-4-hydroxy-6-hydroxymethyldihydropteridine diphosphokinase
MNDSLCILGLGSNTDATTQLAFAREMLQTFFPDIRFSSVLETEAIGSTFHSPFLNQVAIFHSQLSAYAIQKKLKEIERQAGRQPEDKSQGIVKIDIDLITHDSKVLKKDDLMRDFVQQGINELKEQY